MIGKVLDNRYDLVEFIGKGGMALVYRAVDRRTGHSVAVKILRPEYNQDAEFSARFQREALAASRMSHHNIVNLLDVGQVDNMRYLVMEYVQGRTLKEVIRQKGALPPTIAAQIGIRILSALQHAHKKGIIHRDIKPQNVLVDQDGLIKVADFGIARVAGWDTVSSEDSVMGSVHYFSPEQAQGKPVTAASDLYSVGVVLYEMLTGKPPFEGETPVAVAMQHIGSKARPISEINPAVPPAMERVVEKAMEKKPANRYQSAFEMAQDLQRALQEPDGTWMTRLPDKTALNQELHSGNTGKQNTVSSGSSVWKRAGAAVMILVVIGGMLFGALRIYDQVVNTTEAPYCLDEEEADARRLAIRAGLLLEITRTSDAIKPTGTVIMQSPEYGTIMRKGETLCLTISTGPEEQQIPNLIGKTVDEAKTELDRFGFTLLALPNRVISNSPWDTVLTQKPAPGDMMPNGTVVQVTLSGGSVTLPDFVGMTRKDALFMVQQMKLTLVEIREIPVDDATQFERVAAQFISDGDSKEFKPGDQVMQQTQVTLAVYVPSEAAKAATATTEPASTPRQEATP
ncbi:MAG: Stk1 family PASTA domain-containing Ser/Thr kinase [Clostridia bacterium]|nr:Stk1 family PASTA domain-containing Ser/Thr kinase [Clostridia bacterium]